jgi:hypothetical protein
LATSESAQADTPLRSLQSRALRFFQSPKSIFGLWRRYFAERPPTHDPEECVTLNDLCYSNPAHAAPHDQPISGLQSTQPCEPTPSFYPYPNEASFRLGHWYWNGSVQKSQESFKELLEIVGDPDFDPSDIRHVKWNQINAKLGSHGAEDVDEWMDIDAGWNKKRIDIPVPFHRRAQDPGIHHYIGADLYYRSLVDVIKEKLANPHDFERFHLEPYEFFWQPTSGQDEVKVHGELYTSQAFLETHRELQDSPGEPDCELPRVVAALMFWSDSTHLTSFGNAKLWPCYMYFGNESKYRRCKLSCHLCNHVAYFQKVSWWIYLYGSL